MGDISQRLKDIPIILPLLLISFTIHELAHAWVANKLGDPTPKNQGRLTLNPFAHADFLGTILFVIAGFGWAKPVQINPTFFKNRKYGNLLVSLAGPLSNFLAAFLLAQILKYSSIPYATVWMIIIIAININIVLAVFNMIPIPPLDGSKILFSLLPRKLAYEYAKIEQYSTLIFILMIMTDYIDKILVPLINAAYTLIGLR